MNSFSFLIAFVAACTLTIAGANPCGYENADCGSSAGGLFGGRILSAGRMVQANSNSWSSVDAGSCDAGAGNWNSASVVNAMPIASSGCNDDAAQYNSAPISAVSDFDDNTGYNAGYNAGYAGESADFAPAGESCHQQQPPRMLVSQQRHPIIVNRPATNVVVNQPADIVKAKPVVIKRPPGVIVRPIIKNVYPRPIKVQPVIVRAIRPVEKHFVKKSYEDCAGPVWSHTKVVPDC